MFIKKTNDGITQNTTIQQAIDAGALDAKSIGTGEGNGFDYVQETVPTNAKQGEIWFRPSTFEIFVMGDNNRWTGSKGTIIDGVQETPPGEANQVSRFGLKKKAPQNVSASQEAPQAQESPQVKINQAPTAPTNANAFPASVEARKQVQFIFSGATDSDGTVQSYKVSDISDPVITCDNPVVAAGSPHLFTVGSLSDGGSRSVTFKVSAIDNEGLESNKVQVTTNVQDLRVPSAPTNARSFPAIIAEPGRQGRFTFTGSDIGTHYEVYDFSDNNLTVDQARVAAGQPHVFNGVSEALRVTFKVKAISAQGFDSEPVTVTTKVQKDATKPGSQPEPGAVGFGVGLAPDHLARKYGMTLLSNQPGDDQYGNYQHTTSRSIMVWIPRFYFKITEDSRAPYFGTRFDVSFEQKQGYLIHRAFIDGGREVPGFFIDKYHCGVNRFGNCTSRSGIAPTVCHVDTILTNKITDHYSSRNFQNICGYLLDAVKTRGEAFNLVTVFQMNALAMLADAHYQECYRKNKTSQIAWADVKPYQPKGNNNYLKDYNDPTVTFTQASGAVGGVSLTGSANNLAKTTHNGEKCGVADLNGNVYRLCIGIKKGSVRNETGMKIMKETVYAKNINRNNIESDSLYYFSSIPFDNDSNGFGDGIKNAFLMSSGRDQTYHLTCAGIPTSSYAIKLNWRREKYVGSSERFGYDSLYLGHGPYPLCGGASDQNNNAGIWSRIFSCNLNYNYNNVGFSASLYPH